MIWIILSLNILNGDFTLAGNFKTQLACISALKTTGTNESVSHIRQCVQIEQKHLADYKKDKRDWSKLR